MHSTLHSEMRTITVKNSDKDHDQMTQMKSVLFSTKFMA